MSFTNWPENIHNDNVIIHYPTNDDEIINILNQARDNNKIIRVVGSSHSTSPAVSNSKEKLSLISLSQYQLMPENLTIDHKELTVRVNAGWTLGKLYDQLNVYRYFLETQPASSAFTVGGVISMPIHGSRLGASYISDTITEITFIDMSGKRITKTILDNDFNTYRINLGLFGVVISVTFKVNHIKNIKTKVKLYSDVFLANGKFNRDIMSDKLNEIIKDCYGTKIRYNHSFLDMHNNKWLSTDWKPTDQEPGIYIDTKEQEEVTKEKAFEGFHRYIVPHYRENKTYLKLLGATMLGSIYGFIKKNTFEDHDMFWVSTGTRVFFLSYLIPIHTEGDEINLDNLCSALEVIMEHVNTANKFNIDFPIDIRFVCSSNLSLASPIRNQKKTVYMALDLTCAAANLDLSANVKTCKLFDCMFGMDFKGLNKDFRRYYYEIQEAWKQLGGVPHYAKLFGFSSATGNPFEPAQISNILGPDVKDILRKQAQPLFMNKFVEQLLS